MQQLVDDFDVNSPVAAGPMYPPFVS